MARRKSPTQKVAQDMIEDAEVLDQTVPLHVWLREQADLAEAGELVGMSYVFFGHTGALRDYGYRNLTPAQHAQAASYTQAQFTMTLYDSSKAGKRTMH